MSHKVVQLTHTGFFRHSAVLHVYNPPNTTQVSVHFVYAFRESVFFNTCIFPNGHLKFDR